MWLEHRAGLRAEVSIDDSGVRCFCQSCCHNYAHQKKGRKQKACMLFFLFSFLFFFHVDMIGDVSTVELLSRVKVMTHLILTICVKELQGRRCGVGNTVSQVHLK